MSRLNPKLQLQLLTELPSGLDGQKLVSQKRSSYKVLFRAAGLLAAFSGLAMQAPSAWALDFDWGNGSFLWPAGSQTQVYQVGGVTFTFQHIVPAGVGVNTATRPQLGNTLITANPNTPITGGLSRGNVLLGINNSTDPLEVDDLSDSLQLVMEATNAAGDLVPLDSVSYTIIDIDRSCNRGDAPLPAEILWQDVVSTRGLLGGAAGTPVTPAINGPIGETVEDITTTVATSAGYTPDSGSLTFRGVTDPTPETLTDAEGNAGCNEPAGGGNDDNRGVEASNNLAQPPGIAEGNVAFTINNAFTDRIEFEFGNGVTSGANNGLSEALFSEPEGHGIGVFGDLSLNPAIVGISETSTAPVLQTTGAEAGQYLVTYTLRVTNPGETALDNITVENDLVTTFVSAGGFSVVPGSITGALAGETFNGGDTTDISGGAITADNLISLDGGQLAAGASRDITFNVLIDPAVAGLGPFSNQSIVRANPVNSTSGVADAGVVVRDRSSNANTVAALNSDADEDDPDDGSTPIAGSSFANPFNALPVTIDRDTSADNDPSNNDSPTVVVINPAPEIGVTKQVSNVTDNNDGTYTVTYRQIVRNLGNEALNGVALTDQDFNTTFRTGTATGVTSATFVGGSVSVPVAAPAGFPTGYTPLTGTPAFDGAGNLQLATVASLPVGGYGIVDYQVLVDPTDPVDGVTENLGDGTLGGASPDDDNPYESQVTATGTGATSTTAVTDLSDDVTGFPAAADQLPRDLNGNGTATDPISGGIPTSSPIPADPTNDETTDENNRTPVTFTGSPAIALSKRVTNVTANPDGTFDVTYRQLVQNIGPTTLDNVQIAENASIADEYRVGQPNGAISADVQSVTALPAASITVPGAPGAVTLTAGTPIDLATSQTQLAGTDTLQPGEYGAVEYVVRVTPGDTTEAHGGGAAPFTAQATATGTATSLPGSPEVTDPSDDGVEFPNGATGVTQNQVLDPDNNGNANEGTATLVPIDADGNTTTAATQDSENNPTPVRFPKLAISKNISNVTGSGTAADPYIVSYDVTVQNVGGIRLNGVQVTEDNIDLVFDDLPPGDTTVIGPVTPVAGVTPTVNPAFDGDGTPELIDPANPLTLEPNESSTLRYQVQVINPTDGRPYGSSSTTSGTGIPSDGNGPVAGNPLTVTGDANADGTLEAPAATGILPVSDLSDDGTNPDPTPADGNRGGGPGENDPTVITFPVGPQIGLTKQVISTVPNPDGSFDVTFEYRVQNVGIVPLNGLDITDNYDTQFDIGQPTAVNNYEVISVTPGAAETPGGPTLVGNAATVGSAPNSGDLSVATGNTTVFAPGEAATTQVVVRVTPQAGQLATVYDNSAVASGTSTVDPTQTDTDISDDIPPVGATDPRVITADPGILGDGTAGQSAADATPVVFELATPGLQLFKTITSTSRFGPINTQLPGAPAGVIGTNQVPEELQPGDVVEYSIYYFNNNSTVFPGLEICDALPSPLTAVLPITGGSFINALTPLPLADTTGRSCPDGTSGTQGAVIFPVGDVAPSSNGSVVFSTQVQ